MGMDKPIKKKKWTPKRLLKWSLVIIFVLVVVYGLVFRTGGSILKVDRERITISTVKKGPFQEFIPVMGNVMPHKTQYLDAVIGGRVEKKYVEAGSQVKEGDIIIKLSNTNLLMTLLNNEAQVNRASNDLRSTRLQLERNRLDLENQRADADYFLQKIKRKYERNEVLFKEKMISKQEYEELKDEYEYQMKKRTLTIKTQEKELKFMEEQVSQLQASVKRMDESLKLLKEQLENLTVRAPISGHLTSLDAEVGESKSPGDRLGQIDEMEGFKVRAQIDEHYINRIEIDRIGQFDFSGITYSLIVKKIFPEVKEGKFEVDLEFTDKEPAGIKRGQTLHIRLQLSEMSEALLLSRGGFYQTTGGNWVYLLDGSGGLAFKKPIRLGRQNPEYFEVLEGLKPGEQVITSSYENFGNMERLILK